MEMIKRLEPLWLLLVVVGALNWGFVGLFEENVIHNIFGSGTFTDVLYTVIGVAALTFVPKLVDELMHFGDYTAAHRA